MIQHATDNGLSETRNEAAPASEDLRRDFKKILDACRGFFEVVRLDATEHVAAGIYTAIPEQCRDARLSYSPEDRSVRLLIRLGRARTNPPELYLVLVKIQASTKLARFTCDERRDGLTLEATSSCADPDRSRPVVGLMSDSLRQALRDTRLKAVLED